MSRMIQLPESVVWDLVDLLWDDDSVDPSDSRVIRLRHIIQDKVDRMAARQEFQQKIRSGADDR